jgi:hypothetical protein
MMGGTKYRYEVQIDNSGKGIKGVTYSYQTTRFYGKASLIGMWTPSTKNLVMKEEKMQELKIDGGGEGCLMTCYLDYHKEGDKEYLEGNYSSRNMNTGADCGGGRVYLERVVDTDFEKEDFLKKNQKKSSAPEVKIKPGQEDYLVTKPDTNTSKSAKKATPPVVKATPPPAKPTPKKTTPPSTVKKTTPPATTTKPVAKPTVKPKPAPATPPVASAKKPATTTPPKTTIQQSPATKPVSSSKTELDKDKIKVEPNVTVKATTPKVVAPPPVLKERTNELFQTIITSAKEILVRKKGLSTQPINLKIQLGDEDPDHDIVMVAENLGSIPPNTALMIVEAGKQRYTLRLSSTEQKNAMVRFRYQKEEK